MRSAFAAVGCMLLLLSSVSARAAGPAPARLSPEVRDRFAAALSAYRAQDWAQAARELAEISRTAAPIAEYALLHQAESLARLGDVAGARAAAQQAVDTAPDSRAAPPALLLAAEQASRAGDDAGAAGLWRRFLDRFPDHLQAPRARLRMGQSLAASGRAGEAAATYRDLWLTTPGTPQADAAAREIRALEARGIPIAPLTQTLRIERAERLAAAGVDRLVADYPKAPEADDALLLKARILEAGPDPKSAEPVYLKLAQNYPDTDEGLRGAWKIGWFSWLRADYVEAAERWSRILTLRTASQNYRDAALYWTARAQSAAGQADSAAKHFAQIISESPRSYYGVLASRRAPRVLPAPGRNPAAAQLAASLPGDPRELLQADPPYARVEALHAVGLDDFAIEEMDELVRRSLGDARRLYALSTAYAQDERYFLALRILKRHFLGLARSAPPTVPRAFWDVYYPLGWRAELTDAASRASVDPFLVAAVVREESSFDPQARSRVGARGLMQLMPD